MLTKYINWRRLAVGLAVLLALGLPLYFLSPWTEPDPSIRAGVLVDTPAAPERGLEVGVAAGKLAPDFELSRPDGSRFRLSDLRGSPVLINFWARWCGSCLSEMPVIRTLQEERGIESFSVVVVNAGETRKEALEFIDFLQAPFIYGLDTDLTVADGYGVYGLPMSVFVDASGVVQAVYRGHAERALLESFLAAATAAQPAGPVTPVLRIVSTIPRERVLNVEEDGETLVLTSRAFRCDASYCATSLVRGLGEVSGVQAVDASNGPKDGRVVVRYDARTNDAAAVAAAIASAIEGWADPVYEGSVRLVLSRE